jgi:hypothetical protein
MTTEGRNIQIYNTLISNIDEKNALKFENTNLKLENEKLKLENEKLKAEIIEMENSQLKAKKIETDKKTASIEEKIELLENTEKTS